MGIYEKLLNGGSTMSVVGLGYVGLPIALAFAKQIKVIGFDINAERVELMRKNIDPSNEIESSNFEGCDITFTTDPDDLKQAQFHIIAVPTPINRSNHPDLNPLLKASATVGRALKTGDYVVYESTVYPGCTEEDCVPILEEVSGLKFNSDFKVGYSPERINPGDKVNTIETIVKVVSGSCNESADQIARTYDLVVKAGIHKAPSIKVAEASKIIENTQRDVNIALMNELSIIFERIGINTYDVLEAAETKWNFLKFSPGLVGGHCISIDPYYLTWKSDKLGYHARVINSGRFVNDAMGAHVGKQVVKRILAQGRNLLDSRVLVMGMTFKENVADTRNSKVIDVIQELMSYNIDVDVVDPFADPVEVEEEYALTIKDVPETGAYDAIVLAVAHSPYTAMKEEDFAALVRNEKGVFADIKGLYRGQIHALDYWSL